MKYERNETSTSLPDLVTQYAAFIALALMVADLYVHPQGGIAIRELRDDLPLGLGRYVGNAVVSGGIATATVFTHHYLRQIKHPIAQKSADFILKFGLATMLVANIDIEMTTPQNLGQGALDAGIGILTGTTTAVAFSGALKGDGKRFFPRMVGSSADEIFSPH